jgi:hypothetical protein
MSLWKINYFGTVLSYKCYNSEVNSLRLKNQKQKIMKKLFIPLAFAAVFSACNSKKEEEKRDMLFVSDTTALINNVNSDTATATLAAPAPAAPVSQYTAPKPRKAAPTYRKPTRNVVTRSNEPAPVSTAPAPATSGTETGSGTAGSGTSGTGTVDNTTTMPEKKEGISKAAKGAVIGGVAGAAAGAILTKKGKGAVIGGVVGAAGGYILGRKKDKADGRTGN